MNMQACTDGETAQKPVLRIGVSHMPFYDPAVHMCSVPNRPVTMCWNCSHPLTPAGIFHGHPELAEECREEHPAFYQKVLSVLRLPEQPINIPSGAAGSFLGRACCVGCAREVIHKEKRGSNAHARLMLYCQKHRRCEFDSIKGGSPQFDWRLKRGFGGPVDSFDTEAGMSVQAIDPIFALFEEDDNQQEYIKTGSRMSKYMASPDDMNDVCVAPEDATAGNEDTPEDTSQPDQAVQPDQSVPSDQNNVVGQTATPAEGNTQQTASSATTAAATSATTAAATPAAKNKRKTKKPKPKKTGWKF
jgi:hypothetical protein